MATKALLASGVLYTDRRKFYLEDSTFAELYPEVGMFVTILNGMGSRKPDDPDYKMFEHRAAWRYQYLDSAGASAWDNNADVTVAGTPKDTVTIACDGATGVTIDSSLLNHEVEIWDSTLATYKGAAVVTAVSAPNVTLKSLGKADAANQACSAIADNDRFYIIGTAFGEGTDAPEARSDELEVVWNSCQEMKTSVEVTTVLANAILRGATNELVRLRMDKAKEHKIKMARAIYWGHRSGGIGGTAYGAADNNDTTFIDHITDANSNTVRTTMGLITALKRYGRTSGDQQNVFSRPMATYTYNQFVDDMDKVFQYGSESEMVAICGPGALKFWSKTGSEGILASDASTHRINVDLTSPEQSSLGFNFRRLVTPCGALTLVKEELFRGTPYNNHMVIINRSNVSMQKFESDEYLTNIKTDNAPRIIKDQYYSHLGLGITLMESHSLIKLT